MSVKKGAVTQMRTTVINRSNSYKSSLPSSVISRSSSFRASLGSQSFTEGVLPKLSHTAVEDVLDIKAKEKQQLQGLNERFASYIEQVRFLQAQNKALLAENEKLKGQKGFDSSSIKELYQQELDSCKKIIEEISIERANFDAKMAGLQDSLDTEKREHAESLKIIAELKIKVKSLGDQVGQYEGEVTTLRGQIDFYDEEITSMKAKIKRLEDDCCRLRTDLDEETIKRIEAENAKQTIWEDYQFQMGVCDAEITELRALLDKDKQVEISNIWKGELSKAIIEIQEEYDRQLNIVRADLQSRFEAKMHQIEVGVVKDNSELLRARDDGKTLKLKIETMYKQLSDFEAENNKLKAQLQLYIEEKEQLQLMYDADARKWALEMEESSARFEAIRQQLLVLEDAKLSLEMEISVYRKLLEGEEYKIKSFQEAAKTVVRQRTQHSVKSGRLVMRRSHRGKMNIDEVSPDGICVTLKNDGDKETNLKGWKIIRKGEDETDNVEYTLSDVTLKPGKTYTIYGTGYQGDLGENEVKANFFSWGAGDGVYKLFDTENKEERSKLEMDYEI